MLVCSDSPAISQSGHCTPNFYWGLFKRWGVGAMGGKQTTSALRLQIERKNKGNHVCLNILVVVHWRLALEPTHYRRGN